MTENKFSKLPNLAFFRYFRIYTKIKRPALDYVERNRTSKEHCSLSAYAILFLDLDDVSSESSQMSGGKEQDMKLGFLNLDKILSLGLIPRSAKDESY